MNHNDVRQADHKAVSEALLEGIVRQTMAKRDFFSEVGIRRVC